MSYEFVVCVGGPGAGKSTLYNLMFSSTHKLLDSDVLKKQHERYEELVKTEDGVEELHVWARPRLKSLVEEELEACTQDLVYLTTGRKIDKIRDYIQRAHDKGFRIRLADVVTTLQTSLKQNKTRPRSLSDDMVTERYREYEAAVENLVPFVEALNGYYERFHPSNLVSFVGENAEKLAETCKGMRHNAVDFIGVERDVYLDIKINSISEINEDFKSSFRIDWRVSAVWQDPEVPPSAGLFLDDTTFDKLWITKIFPHDVDATEDVVSPYCKLVQEKQGAVVRHLARWSCVSKCMFDLRHFPYDKHQLIASVYAPKTCDKHVKLHIRKVEFAYKDRTETTSGSWLLYAKYQQVGPFYGGNAPQVGIAIPVERDPTRYIWSVEVMFFLQTASIVIATLIPLSNIEFRVEVILGILLTVFAFKISIDPLLPAKAYFNALSSMLFWNMSTCLILTFEAIFMASRQGDNRQWIRQCDVWFCAVVAALWGAYTVFRTIRVLWWKYGDRVVAWSCPGKVFVGNDNGMT